MKWFSLLTVGMMSLCALGSAKDTGCGINCSPAPKSKSISVQYTPKTNITLKAGQAIRLDQVVNIWKRGFAVSKDGTMIQIKKAGSYDMSFFLLLMTQAQPLPAIQGINPVPAGIPVNFEFSQNGRTNWKVLNQYTVTPNNIFTSPLFTFPVTCKGGYVRLVFVSGKGVYLPGGSTDVGMTIGLSAK